LQCEIFFEQIIQSNMMCTLRHEIKNPQAHWFLLVVCFCASRSQNASIVLFIS